MTDRPLRVGSNISKVKAHNVSAVLSILRQHEPVSRVRLAELTGLSNTTITNLISELLEDGLLVEDGLQKPVQPRVGRPRTSLRLVPNARCAVGIHVGVGSIRIALTDLRAQPQALFSFAHPLDQAPEEVLAFTAAHVRDVVKQAGVDPAKIVGVGVGASGLVNPHTGVNVVAPNLGWRDVPVRDWLARDLGLPVCVDNNARAMALGEALFGAGKGVHALAFVYARIGVGAGLVVGEQLFRGSAAGAGEIGHITIIPEGGEPCRCGNTGCLETLVSEPVITRLGQELAGREPGGLLARFLHTGTGSEIDRILAAARAGDEATRAMLEERACFLGIALANLVNVLNPDLIVLGGLCAQGQDLLVPTIERVMRQRAFAGLGDHVRVETTRFGAQAGVIGAAALALDAFFYQPAEVTT